jgi:hypothetical protein
LLAAERRSVGRRESVGAIELSELGFWFQLTPPDGPLDSDWNRLLNVVADFRVVVGHRVLFSEVSFPIIELANQLDRWLASDAQSPSEFIYSSLESNIAGIIRIAPGIQGWHVSSAFAEFADSTPFSLAEIVAAARGYVSAVEQSVLSEYGFRPSELSPS